MQWVLNRFRLLPNKQTFPVGSVTLAPMMSSFCLVVTSLSCKLYYWLRIDCESKGCTRAMLVGSGPKLCTADCVDINLWSCLLQKKRKNLLPLTYMRVIYFGVLLILGAHSDTKFNHNCSNWPTLLQLTKVMRQRQLSSCFNTSQTTRKTCSPKPYKRYCFKMLK